MNIKLHRNATTTPRIRAEIRASDLPNNQLAEQYGIHPNTVAKWKQREAPHDRSHRPHKLQTTLSEIQEAIVVELRKTLLLPLDDLLAVTREFICAEASRSGLDRLLRRHGVSNLAEMKRQRLAEAQEAAGEEKKHKTFKDYEPGYVHVDIKYLPQMKDETSRSYLLVAIDRATRWVYLEVVRDKTAKRAAAFLRRLVAKAPFRIVRLLTDNGKEFTDRFVATGEREPTGQHEFDRECAKHAIEHRLIEPRHPQTNGMVERFNGRIGDILRTTRFEGAEDLRQTLERYNRVYNQHIPQRALGHVAPIAVLKQWQNERPDLFNKPVYDMPGLDTRGVLWGTGRGQKKTASRGHISVGRWRDQGGGHVYLCQPYSQITGHRIVERDPCCRGWPRVFSQG